MSDASPDGPRDHIEARKAVARAVLTTPGVVRLEPSLRQAVQHLASWRRLWGEKQGREWELVELVTEASGVSTRVDIGVDLSRTFVEIGTDVRTRVRGALADSGLQAGRVDVSILTARH